MYLYMYNYARRTIAQRVNENSAFVSSFYFSLRLFRSYSRRLRKSLTSRKIWDIYVFLFTFFPSYYLSATCRSVEFEIDYYSVLRCISLHECIVVILKSHFSIKPHARTLACVYFGVWPPAARNHCFSGWKTNYFPDCKYNVCNPRREASRARTLCIIRLCEESFNRPYPLQS